VRKRHAGTVRAHGRFTTLWVVFNTPPRWRLSGANTMPTDDIPATARLGGHPLHTLLAPAPLVCFVGTLITDLAYWRTAEMQWANMSAWLLTAGLLVSVLVVIAGVIDFFGSRRVRTLRPAWIHAVGDTLALALAVLNAFVHSRDAYTSVVPLGLFLSLLVVVILCVTSWSGGSLVYRYGVGVRSEADR
jgi:uncharacterized membrane protein